MTDNIKNLFEQIDEKSNFIKLVAKEVGNTPLSIRTHWFSNFWAIPEKHQERVVELLQNTIKNQKQTP